MKKSIMLATAAMSVAFCLTSARAAEDKRAWPWSPIGIGIAAPIQLPYMSSDVYGLRLGGLFGYNNEMCGLDVGLVEISSYSMSGMQVSAFSWTDSDAYGLQYGGLANVVDGSFYGFQSALVNVDWDEFWGLQHGAVNYDGAFFGVQFGALISWNNSVSAGWQTSLVNADQEDFVGFSAGVVNYANKMTGFQLGVVNTAYETTGFQLGAFNATDKMHGVQIGVVNLISSSSVLPAMIIANASF